MAIWQVEPSFVHVFWSLPKLLILLWVVTACFLRYFPKNEVFEVFWQDLASNIFEIETKGFWLQILRRNKTWGILLAFKMTWNFYRGILCPRMSQQGFVLSLYAMSLLHKKNLWFLVSKAMLVCTCSLTFAFFLSCQSYCATKEQSQKNLMALVPLQQVEVFCHDDDDILDNGKLNTERPWEKKVTAIWRAQEDTNKEIIIFFSASQQVTSNSWNTKGLPRPGMWRKWNVLWEKYLYGVCNS